MRTASQELNTSRRALVVQWFSGVAFLGAIVVLMLLDRLGLPLGTGLSVLSVALGILVITIVLAGTTISSPLFFFAGRKLDPSVLGIGGASDFVGAAFLLAVLGMPPGQQAEMVAALVTGMVLQAVLFVPAAYWRPCRLRNTARCNRCSMRFRPLLRPCKTSSCATR